MVAKAECVKRLKAIDRRFEIVALCETARGVAAAENSRRTTRSSALMWGAEDLVASLGGTSSRKPNGRYRDIARYARARVLLAAGARGKAAIDAVHLDIAETKRLAIEAADAAASGFAATACIHPSQVEIIRDGVPPRREDRRVGARRAGGRRDAAAGSSPTTAAWSTSRCSGTRARCSRRASQRSSDGLRSSAAASVAAPTDAARCATIAPRSPADQLVRDRLRCAGRRTESFSAR